jgi:tetratricopeptide (TPR) repeat protein
MSSEFPYPGLRPFARDETDIFFGREEHTDQLIDRLGHLHFVAVVGPSGCGKSSLVRTGLLAGLEAGFLSSAGARWCVAELRPGNHPFANLTDALLTDNALGSEYVGHVTSYFTEPAETAAFLSAGSHRAMLQAQLRRGPFSIHELLEYVPLPQHTRLLILVDQFEEIFRYYQQGAEDEAAAFVSLLLASSQHPDVYVVTTMRSDFLGDCALFHGLPEAINHGLYLAPRLNREQLRAAIEEPAAVFEGKIEPVLVNHLLNDAGNNPDQLPVLQHALMRMWTMASTPSSAAGDNGTTDGVTLTMNHYRQIGGLDAALSQHADEAYNQLDPTQQKIAELMFRSLSERSDRRDTRRPVALGEVAELATVPWPQVAAVVEVFRQEGRSFLTPPVGRELAPDSVLDISHESLIRQWGRLQEWTTQEAEAAELYQRLEDSACRWEKGQAALWRTPELENALAWRERAAPTAEWAKRYGQHFDLAMRFLKASAARQQEEEQQAEAGRQRELRQARRQVTLLVVGLVVSIALALWAVSAQQQAHRSEERALLALAQTEAARQEVAASAEEAIAARAKAEESFQQARGVVDDVLTQLGDEKTKDVPGFQPVRKELVEVALKYYRGFIEQRGNDPSVRAELGRTYFRIGRITSDMGADAQALKAYDEAVKIQQHLLEVNPDHPDYLSDLGRTYYSIGENYMFANHLNEALHSLEKARSVQQKLIDLHPNIDQYQHEIANTANRLGSTHTFLKNGNEAEYWFNKNLEIHHMLTAKDPKEPKYKLELSRCYNNLSILHSQEGRKTERLVALERATEIIDELLQEHPNVQHYRSVAGIAYSNLVDAQIRLGNQERAKHALEKSMGITTKLIKENPLIPKYKEQLTNLYVIMVNTLQQEDKLDAAIGAYRELLEAKPDHTNAWNSLGLLLKSQGKLDDTIAAYRKQLEIIPTHEHAWNNLGMVLSQQGKLDDAVAAYRKQLEIIPTHEHAWNNLGNVLQRQGKVDDAIATYRKQLEITPSHEHAWNNLGWVFAQQDKLDDAIAAYRKQVEITPTHEHAWNNLGLALQRQDKLDDAIAAYRQQGIATPNHQYAWNNLGLLLQRQGKLDDAIAAYQQQVQVKPDHGDAWNNLGVTLRQQGKLEAAIAAYQQQVQVRPDHGDAWNNLGVVLFKQGRNDEASAIFAKGLAVLPQHLNLLSNDAELALAQGDITRLQARVDAALPQVTRRDELFVILRFLAWLANPGQSWATVMTAISQLEPDVKFSWDFSDTRRAITHLDVSTQQMAQYFIDFFEDKIDLPTLQTRLSSN